MELSIDDSFFQSDSPKEQTDCNQNQLNEKETYCAKICELGWYLKEGASSSVGTLDATNTLSTSVCTGHHDAAGTSECSASRDKRTCPRQNDFMLLKYQADLMYSLKDFRSAVGFFEQVLELLPPLNAMVKREVIDSLVRCYSQLGQHEQAKDRAKQLVLPPHSGDASSWKLLAQCQKNAGDVEDHMKSLQKCIALERQHGDFWVTLAEGYRLLRETKFSTGGPESTSVTEAAAKGEYDGSSDEEWRMCQDILSNTVSLLRPYFSWRGLVSKPHRTEENDTLLKELTNQFEIVGEGKEPSVNVDHAEELKICNSDCPFFSHSHSVSVSGLLCLSLVMERLLSPNFPNVCLIHSPFVLLASRQATVEEFIGLLKTASEQKAATLLKNVYSLSECSCYLWARQLLIYSVRYSNSFARVAMTTKLQQVKEHLNSFNQETITFLLNHFTQRTVK